MKTKNIALMLSETLSHYNADKIIQGSYWDKVLNQGCFIGCWTHSNSAQEVADKFGIDLPLVKLLERTFEKLSSDDAKEFFKAIPTAIGEDGRDLSLVRWAFLRDTLKTLPTQKETIQAVIDPVIAGMTLLADGKQWPAAAATAYAVANAAYAAANAAYAAAYAANAHAYAANAAAYAAAYAANAHAYAADDAANAHAYAADDAAKNTEYKRQAASILALISAA